MEYPLIKPSNYITFILENSPFTVTAIIKIQVLVLHVEFETYI